LNDEILRLIYAAIDEVNAQALDGRVVEKHRETALLGGDQGIDSLTFVNLIVALEEQIQQSLRKSVVLVDENSMSLQDQPFRTVGTLADYVERVVAQQPS
jgi:acyl carrier protein